VEAGNKYLTVRPIQLITILALQKSPKDEIIASGYELSTINYELNGIWPRNTPGISRSGFYASS
jgi:hypothetical protein